MTRDNGQDVENALVAQSHVMGPDDITFPGKSLCGRDFQTLHQWSLESGYKREVCPVCRELFYAKHKREPWK